MKGVAALGPPNRPIVAHGGKIWRGKQVTDWNKEYSAVVQELAAERARATQWLRERDELRQVGAWVVREWRCPMGNDSDLGQAIEALQGLLKEKP